MNIHKTKREIIQGVHDGRTLTSAIRIVGVTPAELLAWIDSDPKFGQDVLDAQMAFTAKMVGAIEKVAECNPKAARWLEQQGWHSSSKRKKVQSGT